VLEQVTVSRDDVEELFRRLGHEQGALGQIVARLAARPFGELVAPFPEAVRRWSQKEGKLVELVIEGREQLVPASLCSVLGGALAHLLRNAVAHGVEAPAERRAMGKPENGRIEVFCHDRADGVMIGVNDDGAGFDLLALQRRANVQGHVLGDTMDMLDIAALPGISTREASDELAGHGVGLGAVREELRQVGYVLRLVPTNGCGAKISIEPARPSNAPSEGISQAPLAEARHG
jgi:chemotaxis protein histidine kinase CheA